MPSPTTTLYLSSDAGAPVLTGGAGSLASLLYACLVVGYGAKSGAGWTREYAASNGAAFRAGGGNQRYLQVLDNGESAGGTKEARCRGYEAMTDISTGTGPFPTTVQVVNGITVRKSATTDATARNWVLVATNATFHLFIASGDFSGAYHGFSFGDFASYKTGGDDFGTAIVGKAVENDATASNERLGYAAINVASAVITGHYAARSFTGVGSSIQMAKFVDGSKVQLTSSTMGSNQYIAYPNAPDGGLWVSPVWLSQPVASAYVIRGHIQGLWCPMHTQPLSSLDTFDGTGGLAGKTFMAITIPSSGQVMIEISSTWT